MSLAIHVHTCCCSWVTLSPSRSCSLLWVIVRLMVPRTTDLNEKYSLCSSYPRVLVVPASVTDKEVEAISQFRSEQRLPVLCWGRQTDSASIWRSSQPKVIRGVTLPPGDLDFVPCPNVSADKVSQVIAAPYREGSASCADWSLILWVCIL